MEWFELIVSVLIGIIQGITEFLPVSSTAHQSLVSSFLTGGSSISLAQSNFIQFATLIAIIQYFWKDLSVYIDRLRFILTDIRQQKVFVYNVRLWLGGGNSVDGVESAYYRLDREIAQIGVGTIPIVVLGYYLHSLAETYRDVASIIVFLVAGALLMWAAEYIVKSNKFSYVENGGVIQSMNVSETILIGLFQSLAALPGMSRSGSTISGALIIGRPRAEAVRFSFLLSIPALVLAAAYDLFKSLLDLDISSITLLPTAQSATAQVYNLSIVSIIIAGVCAYISGLIVLKWLIGYLSSNTFKPFIIYRFLLAIILIILLQFTDLLRL